ncbi:MAG: EamA family transporter [Clostridia bacterium]|nr:EamA family transporter [Clostridia bacterium]
MKTQSRPVSYIFVIAAAVLWGTMGMFFTLTSSMGLSRMQIVFIRTSGAALMLFILLLAADRKKLKIKLRDIWMFVGTGIVSLFFFNFCYFSAMQLTGLSVAAILLYTAPALVVIMSAVIFKEKITVNKVVALFLTLAGSVVISGVLSGFGLTYSPVGILFGLGSGLGYALYTIFGRVALQKYDSLTISFYTFLFAATASGVFCGPADIVRKVSGIGNWLIIAAVGFVTCLLPYIFYTKGLSGLSNGEASILATIEPVVACLISVLAFGEDFDLNKLLGIILIVASVVVMNIRFSRTDKAE